MGFSRKCAVAVIAAAGLLFAWQGAAYCYAPAGQPVIKPQEQTKKRPKPAAGCTVRGRVFCSEYGTRYKDPVFIVFAEGEDRYQGPVSETDGSFQVDVPPGFEYALRVEFKGKGMDIGGLAVPADCNGVLGRTVEIHHPGSMLELIWEVRDGNTGPGSVDVRIKEDKTE